MKPQVEFQSLKFLPDDHEEETINPGLWGMRLTEYLAEKLAEKGIETGEMSIEDWGCYLPVRNAGFRLALCCGHQSGSEDQFLVFTDPSTPTAKKFFRTLDAMPRLTRLLAALRQIIETDPDNREVVWCEPQ